MTDDTTNQAEPDPAPELADWLANEGEPFTETLRQQLKNLLDHDTARRGRIEQQTKDLASARNQRDYLGHQLSDRIARFHALRVAFGETSLDTAGRTTAADLGALENSCRAIAEQAGVTA